MDRLDAKTKISCLRSALRAARDELKQQQMDMRAMPYVSNLKELAEADVKKAQQAIDLCNVTLKATA